MPDAKRPVPDTAVDTEPRWPAFAAVIAVSGLYYGLPDSLSFGPPWLLLGVVTLLLVPTVVTHRQGMHDVNQGLGYVVQAIVTAALAYSVGRLVEALLTGGVPPALLLRAAAAIWVANVLVFAAWYWRLDAGGPNRRDANRATGTSHHGGAFLFPQMTGDGASAAGVDGGAWSPEFVDYLFLAFNVSTAFSPTDAPVLSRWAKSLMMVQATISFATVVLLAARAVNVLPS